MKGFRGKNFTKRIHPKGLEGKYVLLHLGNLDEVLDVQIESFRNTL